MTRENLLEIVENLNEAFDRISQLEAEPKPPLAGALPAHDILSVSHSDTVAQIVTRGSLMYGDAAPAWNELPIGAAATFARSDGADVAWSAIQVTDLPVHTHSGAADGGSLVVNTTDTDAAAGSVFFAGAAGELSEDNPGLVWDSANNILTIDGAAAGGLTLSESAADSPAIRWTNATDVIKMYMDHDATPGNSDVVLTLAAADSDSRFIIEDSGGTDVIYFDADGNADFSGHIAVGDNAAVFSTIAANVDEIFTDVAGGVFAMVFRGRAEPAAGFTTSIWGVSGGARLQTAQVQASGTFIGVEGFVAIANLVAGTINEARGGHFFVDIEDGTCTTATTVNVRTPFVHTGNLTTGYGVRIVQGAAAAGVVTQYGLFIGDLTAAGTNWSIFSGSAPSHFGGAVDIDQANAAGAVPVLILDQGDPSEQCIQFSSDGADQDFFLWTIDVGGAPALMWDESETAIIYTGTDIHLNNGAGDMLKLRRSGDVSTTESDIYANTQMGIAADSSVHIFVDADNDTVSAYFSIQKDAEELSSSIELFRVEESGQVGILTGSVPHGGVGAALLALEGVNAATTGPHIQLTTATDDYPLMQILAWQHDNVQIRFDSYFDGAEKSSDAGSNYRIIKLTDLFQIEYDSGVAAGNVIAWNNGLVMDTNGHIVIGGAAPVASGMLELRSTTGALLVSRMTTAQRNALTAVNGMIIYNSSTNAFNFYEAGAWVSGSGLA